MMAGSAARSAKEAKSAVQKCYSCLLKLLPINKLVERFYSRKLLSFDRKSELDSLTSSQEKIKHFLDAILIPGLTVGYTGHFDEMVVMMKESDDVLVEFLIQKLVPDVSVASSSAGASSAALTANTGIKDCNKFLFQDLFLSIWCRIESSSCGCTL